MLRTGLITMGIGLALVFGAGQARAELITFYFGGEITSVSDPDGTLGGAVQIGDSWSGSYTFESTTPDSDPDDPGRGYYQSSAASMSVTIGDLSIVASGDDSRIFVLDRPERDYFSMGSYSFDFGDIPVGELYVSLEDRSGAALSSDTLPLEPPILSDFASSAFHFDGWGDPLRVAGTVDYLAPEPTAIVFGVFGTLWLVSRYRRK